MQPNNLGYAFYCFEIHRGLLTVRDSSDAAAPITFTVPAVPNSSGVFLVDLILRQRKASLITVKATDRLANQRTQSSMFNTSDDTH